ncbi:MAG: ABC transporter permease, partial [Bryobacteraceae bacterium]
RYVLPHLQHVALNGRVLLFNTALCLLLAVLCSLAPVLLASRTDLQGTLRSGHSAAPKNSVRLFSILIASEAAFAFLLLVGSGLLVRSLIRLQEADHGFHPDHVLTMRVPIGTRVGGVAGTHYDTRPKQMAFYHELLDQIRRIPGVRAAAVVNNLPLSGFNTSFTMPSPHGETILMAGRTISPEYFPVMGIPLLKGRLFSDSDRTGSPPVAIINQSFARQLFPDRDPIGQSLPKEGSAGPATRVVGMVKDSAQMSYDGPAVAEMYIPYQQVIFGAFLSTIVVRTAGDPLLLAETLRKAIWAVDPNEPVLKVETMNDVIADSIWRPRFSAWLFSMLGGLALLLTSVGIYGVVAYTTSLRAQEVGIRVALGASPADVVRVILRGSMIPLCVGLTISLAAALLLARLLTSLLYEISPTDPATYIAAGAVLLAIGAAASLRPAWKAATGDPLKALRAE